VKYVGYAVACMNPQHKVLYHVPNSVVLDDFKRVCSNKGKKVTCAIYSYWSLGGVLISFLRPCARISGNTVIPLLSVTHMASATL